LHASAIDDVNEEARQTNVADFFSDDPGVDARRHRCRCCHLQTAEWSESERVGVLDVQANCHDGRRLEPEGFEVAGRGHGPKYADER
jgi:hypothetical protein